MATGSAEVQKGIYSAFGATYSATPTPSGGWPITTWPVVAANSQWSLAKNGAAKQPTDKAWGRFGVTISDVFSTSVDGKAKRVIGFAWLQIFLKEGNGTIEAQAMGDELERVLGRETIVSSGEAIRFERAKVIPIGQTENGWEQHRCTIDFMSDAVTP